LRNGDVISCTAGVEDATLSPRKEACSGIFRELPLESQQGEITLLLTKWKDGDPDAFEALVPLVYPTLREIAASYVRRERTPGVMQATSLVHELYLRLLDQKKAHWNDRAHFYTFSAKVMRMILIDHARGNQAQRRGGKAEHIPLSDDLPWVGIGSVELIELNRALDALALVDAQKVQLVELRYFLGCTADETAELMNISKATVNRDLNYARAWLYRRIDPNAENDFAKI
jgi:RNA polymerase sigma factor (TIGR02999 family)